MSAQKPRTPYQQKLLDPRWQKKRLAIFERDEWACAKCFDSTTTLHVHHRYYDKGKEPWDYPDEALVTLCERCHEEESKQRYIAEQNLLQILRERGLYREDVDNLAVGFWEWNPGDIREVAIQTLIWAMARRDIMDAISDQYHAFLARVTARQKV